MDGLPLINPGFLWAAVGLAAVPIVLYLLNRQRHRRVPWAAMRFLLSASKRSMRRTRLEQILLLLIRTAIMALIGLAIARPFWPYGPASHLLTPGTYHVVILDDSYSMQATRGTSGSDGSTRAFDLQRQRALTLIDEVPNGDPITLIASGHPARLINRQPIFDKTLARRLIQMLANGDSHGDLGNALVLAEHTLQAELTSGTRRESALYIFGDYAKSVLQPLTIDAQPQPGVSATSVLQRLTDRTRVVAYDVGGEHRPNLAIEEVTLAPGHVGTSRPVDLRVTIRNRAARNASESKLQVSVDGQLAREMPVREITTGSAVTLRTTIRFDTPGYHTVEAQLVAAGSNVLTIDDTRRLVVEAKNRISVLLVDGQPGLRRLQGHAGYVATALSPDLAQADTFLFSPTVIGEDAFMRQPLQSTDVLMLCNVRRLDPLQWQRIQQRVMQGMGLVVFMGDLVDLAHYNESASMLMPSTLLGRAYTQQSDSQFTKLDATSIDAGAFSDLQGRHRSGLFSARVHQYIQLQQSVGEGQGLTLLSYASGDPTVMTREVGTGTVLVMTTSANMDWTNMPAKDDFVTFMLHLVHEVATPNAHSRNRLAGQTFEQQLPGNALATPLQSSLQQPDGNETPLDLFVRDDAFFLSTKALDQSGWYHIQQIGAEGPIASNVLSDESDLTPLGEIGLLAAVDAKNLEYVRVNRDEREIVKTPRSEFANVIVYAALMLLFFESLMALWFGHHRR